MTAKKSKRSESKDDKRAEEQAQAQLASIREMVDALRKADESDNDGERDAARQTINEDALSIQVRSDWHQPGEKSDAAEFEILLCTGGPACRIIGNLSGDEPETASIEYQDWFTPWTRLPTSGDDEECMLEYARCFYFGS